MLSLVVLRLLRSLCDARSLLLQGLVQLLQRPKLFYFVADDLAEFVCLRITQHLVLIFLFALINAVIKAHYLRVLAVDSGIRLDGNEVTLGLNGTLTTIIHVEGLHLNGFDIFLALHERGGLQ